MIPTPVPTITFRVNLSAQPFGSYFSPDRCQTDPDQALEDISNRIPRISTWLPSSNGANNRVLHHEDEFTLHGSEALYVKKVYATGDNPILEIVS